MDTRRIICNTSLDYNCSGKGSHSNPIGTYLQKQVAEKLSRNFCEEADNDDVTVIVDFSFETRHGEVTSMCLSFHVRSNGRDILEDVLFFRIFQRVVRSTFNTRRIWLEHKPDNGYGRAEYRTYDTYSSIALLQTIQRMGCDTTSMFVVVPEDCIYEDGRKARIGFFGYGCETKFEMYVKTDDECKVPHVHLRDEFKPQRDIPVTLHGANYYPHNHFEGQFADYELKYLATFMAKPCRSPRFVNNYEYAVEMWNLNNDTQYRCETDEHGSIVIPDYAHTTSIEKREHAMKMGLGVQFDNLYLARMKNEIKNRKWE